MGQTPKTQPHTDNRVFTLASNLFGKSSQVRQDSLPPPIPAAKPGAIMAIYPAIIQESFAMSMDNYRQYIATYNFKTNAENREIDKHNAQLKDLLAKTPPTTLQATALATFNKLYSNEFARDQNEQANRYNAQYGPCIPKKRIPTVKYATELIFQNMLSLYNSQLMKRNEQYMRFAVTTPRPLQEFMINSHLVARMKRNGILSLNLCKKTIRNHRQRLEECGIFQDYRFRGATHDVAVTINPEILAVLDLKTNKIVSAKNEPVSPTKWKDLPDDDDNTRPIIKESKRNADASSPPDKEFAALMPFDLVFYRDTTGKEQNLDGPPPPRDVKVLPPQDPVQPEAAALNNAPAVHPETTTGYSKELTLSDKLLARIIHKQELAQRLTDGEYFNYTYLPIDVLRREAFTGTMTNEEFRELVIQDHFKGASDIWKNGTPYIGSWKKAINLYYAHKFMSFRDAALNKSTILDDIQELRWCVAYARRWFLQNQFRPLFPSDYFDMTRKDKAEIGFEYVRGVIYKKHLKSRDQDTLRKKKTQANAEARKQQRNHAKKCETEVKRFLKNKITLPELIDYVARNLPPEFSERLPQIIDKHLNPKDLKKIYNSMTSD